MPFFADRFNVLEIIKMPNLGGKDIFISIKHREGPIKKKSLTGNFPKELKGSILDTFGLEILIELYRIIVL